MFMLYVSCGTRIPPASGGGPTVCIVVVARVCVSSIFARGFLGQSRGLTHLIANKRELQLTAAIDDGSSYTYSGLHGPHHV